jgi:hypothetical protein
VILLILSVFKTHISIEECIQAVIKGIQGLLRFGLLRQEMPVGTRASKEWLVILPGKAHPAEMSVI